MGDRERAFAVVRCAGDSIPGQQPCGPVELSFAEYERQMARPNRGWDCPHCGSSATYDDVRSERLQGVDEHDDDEDVPR